MISALRDHAGLVRDYLTTDRRQFIERELSDHTQPCAINPFASDYWAFVEEIGQMMEARTIRAWHYCRLTDEEADILKQSGIQLSTTDTLTSLAHSSSAVQRSLFAGLRFRQPGQVTAIASE